MVNVAFSLAPPCQHQNPPIHPSVSDAPLPMRIDLADDKITNTSFQQQHPVVVFAFAMICYTVRVAMMLLLQQRQLPPRRDAFSSPCHAITS